MNEKPNVICFGPFFTTIQQRANALDTTLILKGDTSEYFHTTHQLLKPGMEVNFIRLAGWPQTEIKVTIKEIAFQHEGAGADILLVVSALPINVQEGYQVMIGFRRSLTAPTTPKKQSWWQHLRKKVA